MRIKKRLKIEKNPQEIMNLISQGRSAQAEKELRDILAIDAHIFEAWHLLGVVQLTTGKIDEAIASITHAISLGGCSAAAFSNLAACHIKKREYTTALRWAKKALQVDRQHVSAWANLARAQQKLGDLDAALSSWKKGLTIAPERGDILDSIGEIFALKGDHEGALSYYKKAIEKNHVEAFISLGISLAHLNRYVEALDHIEKAIALQPDLERAETAKGCVLLEMGQFSEAASFYQRLVERYPRSSAAAFSRGFLCLLLGDFASGWPLFEFRTQIEDFISQEKPLPTPRWKGESLEGKTLLVYCEQGLGDSLHFLRYVPLLARYQCKVILELPLSLHCLFGHLKVSLTCREWKTPAHDMHVLLLSLPLIFKTDLSNIPPPLSLPQMRYRPVKNRIGIAWKGNPQHRRDKKRSLDVQCLSCILEIPGVEYVCLQQHITSKERELLEAHGVHIPVLDTFADTLQVLETCALVVCPDSAIAHLAASVGIPTWILIPYVPDWRWLLERSNSPWYPSVRLFRQCLLDDWKDPVERIHREIIQSL